jgi:hypothetical protein
MPSVISVGGSASIGSGYSFGDLVEKVYRRVMSGVSELAVVLTADSGTTLTLSGTQSQALVPGAILSCGLELMLVLSANQSAGTVMVERGYMGSTQVTHSPNDLVYIDPSLSKFDCAVAINDDLNSLSAEGLVRINTAQIVYNPVFAGYDLGDIPTNFTEILELRYKHPFPDRRYPPITRWHVSRYQDTAVFPSGNSLTIFEPGFPGMPMFATYAAPLIPFVSLTDNVCDTPVTNDQDPPYNGYSVSAIPNLPPTAVDIPVLGATIQLVQAREFSRNNFLVQPDPRKATDVPAGAIMNSTQRLEIWRQKRIDEEVARIRKQYGKFAAR